MKNKVIFIGSGFTKKEQKTVKNIIQKTAKDVAQLLDIKSDVTFTVYRFGIWTSGFTQAKDWIRINIKLKQFKEIDLVETVCHEMNHIAREYFGFSNKQYDLLDTLFAEGLAVAFGLHHSKIKKAPAIFQYRIANLKKWFPEIRKKLHSYSFSYDEWFHGVGRPMCLGYKIGRYLVDQIIKNNPEITIESLTKKSANQLLKLSKVKF